MASIYTPSSPVLHVLGPASNDYPIIEKTETPEKSFRFLELPAELRNQIYGYHICQPG